MTALAGGSNSDLALEIAGTVQGMCAAQVGFPQRSLPGPAPRSTVENQQLTTVLIVLSGLSLACRADDASLDLHQHARA